MPPASEAGVQQLDAVMEELLGRRAERLPFLHPIWLRTWLAEFGSDHETLFLDCTHSAATAIAPLMRDNGRVTFIGDPEICDFMDILAEPDPAPETYDAIWQDLCKESWSALDLWGLMASSPTRDCLKNFARGAGYDVSEVKEAVAPRLSLPATWDEYLASLGKKDRHELRRKMRRLLDSGAHFELEVYSEQADVDESMDSFLDLHRRSRADKTEFMTPAMEAFFRRMASAMSAAGLVRLFVLYSDGKPAASVFCFDAGSHLYMYNSGYDFSLSNLSVGLVSKALCLRWAIENGKTGLDFLRGNEPYKYDLGAKDQDIYRLIVRRP